MKRKIGVYICHCGSNIAGYLDVTKLTAYAAALPSVVVARDYTFMCSDPGQDLIKNDIKELGLNGVLVCSCSPTLHLKTFRAACAEAGLNPHQCEMATIRELSSWVHSHDWDAATEKAMALTAAGVRRVLYRNPLESKWAPVNPQILVVGGGIAGIQTALEIASTGEKVYLVEKAPSIGGKMAQLHKTFPNLDTTTEILTPRMAMVAANPNIELLTNSEITEVSGYIGNFKATINKKARGVDAGKCNACGECWHKCPVSVSSEHDRGMQQRKAIYLPFPKAVPGIPVIDKQNCKHFTDGSCSICAAVCPAKAIDYDQADENFETEIGACIIATGYDTFDPTPMTQFGYKKFDNVVTSPEFERILSPDGPTGGQILMKNGNAPKSIAIAHCVGSRDQNYHAYCSRICCMYSLKYSRLIKQMLGPETNVYQMYIDMRCFGKGHEEFYKQASDEGVQFIRGKIGQITDVTQGDEEKGRLIAICEDTLLNNMLRVPVDMVVLSVAMQPRADIEDISRAFLLGRSQDGFFLERHPKLDPIGTMLDGIFSVGCCQSPKDIGDTVAQATGAAARALELISKGRVEMEAATAFVDAEVCAGCGYCEAVCAYSAVAVDEKTKKATVNEAVCKGCGACAATCPSKAMQLKNFSQKQLMDVIDEATREYAGLSKAGVKNV
ncbi:MAG: CoB--CoM heterodisulfide reductase iron-sulfur subunit A family protein [Dehalococcoidales bacterium]|nr:CoB--CoM heterodisulfide reductase iron-sulfur subunit A family protein [Dehalococcoidales bacterium]